MIFNQTGGSAACAAGTTCQVLPSPSDSRTPATVARVATLRGRVPSRTIRRLAAGSKNIRHRSVQCFLPLRSSAKFRRGEAGPADERAAHSLGRPRTGMAATIQSHPTMNRASGTQRHRYFFKGSATGVAGTSLAMRFRAGSRPGLLAAPLPLSDRNCGGLTRWMACRPLPRSVCVTLRRSSAGTGHDFRSASQTAFAVVMSGRPAPGEVRGHCE